MKWYLMAFKNYATFKGRARRKEYWMFFLFNMIFAIVAMVLDSLLGLTFSIEGQSIGYGYIYTAYLLFIIIPSISLLVRRLHDVNKSGWFYWIQLIPLVGQIWILILMVKEGTNGENTYGKDPKGNDSMNNEALDAHLA